MVSSQSQTITNYVDTPYTKFLLQAMLQDHVIGRDICLMGSKGSGKSTIVRHFAASIGQTIETMTLYKDMSTRELLQSRVTRHDGSTDWEFSPLVHAAMLVWSMNNE